MGFLYRLVGPPRFPLTVRPGYTFGTLLATSENIWDNATFAGLVTDNKNFISLVQTINKVVPFATISPFNIQRTAGGLLLARQSLPTWSTPTSKLFNLAAKISPICCASFATPPAVP